MGVEINRITAPTTMLANGSTYRRLSESTIDNDTPPSSPMLLRLHHLNRDPDDPEAPVSSTGETAGIYLGILNLYTTLPQFVGTFISMIVFAIFEPGVSRELAGEGTGTGTGPGIGAVGEREAVKSAQQGGVNAIAVCLFIGALSSLGAAYATWRLKFVR